MEITIARVRRSTSPLLCSTARCATRAAGGQRRAVHGPLNTFERSFCCRASCSTGPVCPRAPRSTSSARRRPAGALLPGGGGGSAAAARVVAGAREHVAQQPLAPLAPPRTRAILSVDDDVLVPCAASSGVRRVARPAAGDGGAPLPPMVGRAAAAAGARARGRWAYRRGRRVARRPHLVLSKAAFVHAAQLAAHARAPRDARRRRARPRRLRTARSRARALGRRRRRAWGRPAGGVGAARVRELASGAGLSTAQARPRHCHRQQRELVDIHGRDLPLSDAGRRRAARPSRIYSRRSPVPRNGGVRLNRDPGGARELALARRGYGCRRRGRRSRQNQAARRSSLPEPSSFDALTSPVTTSFTGVNGVVLVVVVFVFVPLVKGGALCEQIKIA